VNRFADRRVDTLGICWLASLQERCKSDRDTAPAIYRADLRRAHRPLVSWRTRLAHRLLVIAVALIGIALFFLDRLTTAGFWGNFVALGSGLAFASSRFFCGRKSRVTGRSDHPRQHPRRGGGLPFMFQHSLGADSAWRLLLLGTVQLGLPLFFTRRRSNRSRPWRRG